MRKSGFLQRESVQGFLLIAPNTIGLVLFYVVPIVFSILLGFFNWDGLTSMKWAGVANFLALFKDRLFFSAFRNTCVYTIAVVPIILVVVVILGIMLSSQVVRIAAHLRTLYFLPLMTMPVAAALVWKWLLNLRFGLVNKLLTAVGISAVPWLSSPNYILLSIMIIGIWLGVAYDLIVIISGIKSIPSVHYEAAQMDGASSWAQFFHITLPMLTPSIFFVVITQLIACFQVFDTAFIILGSDPPGVLKAAASTMVVSIYENGFIFFKMGYSSAQALILFVVVMVITAIQFRVQNRWVHYA